MGKHKKTYSRFIRYGVHKIKRFFDRKLTRKQRLDETFFQGVVKTVPITYEQSWEIISAHRCGARAERKVIERIEQENRGRKIKHPYTVLRFQEWPIRLPENEVIKLAPNQYSALCNMRNYGSKEQVKELLEVYERANEFRPIDEQKAVRITRADALNGRQDFKGITR